MANTAALKVIIAEQEFICLWFLILIPGRILILWHFSFEIYCYLKSLLFKINTNTEIKIKDEEDGYIYSFI